MAKKKATTVVKPTSQRASARLVKKEKPVYVVEDGSEDEAGDDSESEAAEDITEEDAEIEYVPRYKDDKPNAFNTPVDSDKDFISTMPPEVLDNILSYCVLDHGPELAVKQHKSVPGSWAFYRHVLFAVAAMSKQLRGCVESFSLRQLTSDAKRTGYRTTAEIQDALPDRRKPSRRSTRIAAKPLEDRRVYRMEFVRYLQFSCYKCNTSTMSTALMHNGVACCKPCDRAEYKDLIFLTDALKEFDLRDYMLIPTRKPGPRAKHTDLPLIHYGTRMTGTSMGVGHCISYRFYRKDVERIAKLVHADVKSHMSTKRKERKVRKLKKVRQQKRELKIERYTRLLDNVYYNEKTQSNARERLQHYKDLDVDAEDYDSDAMSDFGYYERRDNHAQLCKRLDCDRCKHSKVDWAKYDMEYMMDAYGYD